ncbi:hypothetical protein AJ79_07715 [Helicocarpus griseus UAMH5409]|uniref:ATPase inhibitor, mitochondrial n=1 Tax=Helicocarpus griseus UAMH5409 TaxID=1447875 RepID=A0A2B7WZW4_9EURO|nr:hypothetical protein AJ79_07715 [Helicocarpus griseus UAMH5409]
MNMIRQCANKCVRPALRPARQPFTRAFTAASQRMGEGDVGTPKSTGTMSTGTSWTKKEAADEALFVKKREMEKLKNLREKLQQQRKHLDELDAHIEKLTKEHGGEQN